MTTIAIVLAAGKGTRMVSDLPKVLFPLRGKSLIARAVSSATAAFGQPPIVVVGLMSDDVRAACGPGVRFATQVQQLGTGHAVKVAADSAQSITADSVAVMYGDMPLLPAEMMMALAAARARSGAAIAMLTLMADNPRGFGRIVRDAGGAVTAIVEEVAATPEQLRIRELNVGVYCFDAAWLWPALERIQPNPRKGEYFLTDLVEIAVADGRQVVAIASEDAEAFIGINTRADLADADAALRRRINRAWMLKGVSMVDPASVYIDDEATLAPDVTILPNTHLLGQTQVGTGSVIGPNCVLRNARIGRGCVVQQSSIEDSILEDGADAGPFARLRGGARIGQGTHIGNFAEIKNSTLGPGVKMGHFSYLGDATVGAEANISAGVITCNFDGKSKQPTTIGEGAFVGCDTMLVAPVTVGARALTGAGAVVTHDVAPGERVAGVPARPLTPKSPGDAR
ncbi:MAG: bifunctional UDP-N-acetylglucosamine diphosphorylase/glucosamine-1-phosphate N-acetyltransferase GlmU [Thermoflexales bacterium]|nr:bifunctional UDP-N-acetylglucosamine diphosphorylase/glucosamine-1-phosphate N-acetyltransferase GlmU [Thermoflexales bacterium]